MPAPDWIDGDEATLGAADQPFHAGITVDLVRGNLLRAIEQGAYGVQMWQIDGDALISQTLVAADGWVRFGACNYLPIPIRKNPDGTWRQYTVSMEGRINAVGKATVRAHLRSMWSAYPLVDATDGLLDETAYTTLEFVNSVGWDLESGTIAPLEVGEMIRPNNDEADTPARGIPVCWLVLIVMCDVSMVLDVRGIRIREIVAI